MSRLIDADAITDKLIVEYLGKDYASCRADIREMIDNAPTVESKKGKWIESVFASGEKGEICSECRTEKPFNDYGYYDTNYCPDCGARMED